MPFRKLVAMVLRNAVRNRGEFALSAFGIVVGIAAFVFFLGLSGGVRAVILGEDLFPIDRLEVVAPKVNVGIELGARLDDSVVERIRARPEVEYAIPRMRLSFPARGEGKFEGQHIPLELGGFCDGIETSFVAGESFADLFRDWETDDYLAQADACAVRDRYVCPRRGFACGSDRLCHPLGRRPEPGEALDPCLRVDDYYCEDSAHHYCDLRDRKCHHRVPVLVSPAFIEIFNNSFAASHGLPRIPTGGITAFIALRGYRAMGFDIVLGESYVSGSKAVKAPPRRVGAYVIGETNKAMPIGATIPIDYIKRWNREYEGDDAAAQYSSIVVKVRDKEDIARFSAWLRSDLGLELEDSQGERFATAIFIVTALFVLISFIIVLISAINIAHTFFMQVSERRREIGLLRALGATQADVRLLILGEASVIGLIGGGVGVGLAVAAGWAIDMASKRWLPEFPFKPETYFSFGPAIVAGGVVFAVLFCILGGYLPARRAARMEPAQALAAD
ncbi:MAG: ABC transporter permease [Deltaproteobacteria bacterium]|nr:MAG: ABC transporter permease [Deltaproteobacteria bacterium]